MTPKIPPQLRLAELEAARVQIRKRLQAARTGVSRAAWGKNEDVLKLKRELKLLGSKCTFHRRALLALSSKPEDLAKYAKYEARRVRTRHSCYRKNKNDEAEKRKAWLQRKRASQAADPAWLQAKAVRKTAQNKKHGAFMKEHLKERFKDHVYIDTPARRSLKQKQYMTRPEAKARRLAWCQQPAVAEKKKEYARVYSLGKGKEAQRKYRQRPAVKAALRAWHAKRYKERLQNDSLFAITRRLRGRLYMALKVAGVKKKHKTFDLMGCTVPFFKAHLESLFLPGMTWSNRGEWHIDHKRPCASFDLTDEEQQRLCFHYTNMQPLWKLDNLRKGTKIVEAVLAGTRQL